MSDSKIDPFDVAALEKAVNDCATRVSTVWVSYLVFGLYLVVAAGNVTHRQLFLEDSIKLPVLNIDLALLGFFFLAPILFVIFHAYVLMQVLLLARTAKVYNDAIVENIHIASDQARVRQRLVNTLFAQIFAAPPDDELLGWLLRRMAGITLAFAPIMVLLALEMRFLPYHGAWLTWEHRILVVVDLLAVFMLWFRALDGSGNIAWRNVVRHRIALPFAIAAVLFSGVVLSFPGEPQARWLGGDPVIFTSDAPECRLRYAKDFRISLILEKLIDADKLDRIEKTAKANRLEPHEDKQTRLDEGSRSFEDRDLRCANFAWSDLRRANFTRAEMSGAFLGHTKLQGAKFVETWLRGAYLSEALLQNASLEGARLQGAHLRAAQLQGAYLRVAKLQGADLRNAQLQGADLNGAHLQGADLRDAQLQGAELTYSNLQGADLRDAQLQGADLSHAQLQGANLRGAQLQGANLQGGELKFALLSGVFLWGARGASCSDARIELRPSLSPAGDLISTTPEAIEAFIEHVVADVGDEQKDKVRERLRAGLVAAIQKDDLAAIEAIWRECAANSAKVPQAEYDQKRADFLRGLACDATDNGKEIASGIIRNETVGYLDSRVDSPRLARGLLGLDGKECAATKDLGDLDKKVLLRTLAATPAAAN
jgi:uncharacterized protein YjbI with pentapeptide repeats